jgi:integrase
MASVYRHKSKGFYAVVTLPSRTRCQIYLGHVTKAAADNVARKLGALMASNRIGEPPAPEVAAWLSILIATKSPIVKRLEALGLLAVWSRPADVPTLADYWAAYVERRRDYSDGTRRGWKTAWLHVGAAFPSATLASITVAEAKQFSRDLLLSSAPTHARQILNRLRMVFNDAIDAKIIEQNPFKGIVIAAKADKTRRFYVPEPVALQVLDAFASLEGRALFALARWCGLRMPHEPLALRWSDVDWANGRLAIPRATKTGPRVLPLFPMALRELQTLYDVAPEGSTYVFNRARGSAATSWRNWLEKALDVAKVPQWPSLWNNLRRSCRTDLQKRFPGHVCDAWLGHSGKVAADYYLLVTEADWLNAKTTAADPATVRRAVERTAQDTAPSGTDGNPSA